MQYFDRVGRPIDRLKWHDLYGETDDFDPYRRVALDRVGDIVVSTVWTGRDAEEADPPMIFKTTTSNDFDPYEPGLVRRWATETEAREGHYLLVAQLRHPHNRRRTDRPAT